MLAHLIIGLLFGLAAAVAMAASGGGFPLVLFTYSAAGSLGLLGSATLAAVRHGVR